MRVASIFRLASQSPMMYWGHPVPQAAYEEAIPPSEGAQAVHPPVTAEQRSAAFERIRPEAES
jgi:hypothetical protein